MADDESQTVEGQLKSERANKIYRQAIKKAFELEEENTKFQVDHIEMNFSMPPSVKIIFKRRDGSAPAPQAAPAPQPEPAKAAPAAAAPAAAAADPYTCPTCKGKYRYIQEYQRWYCDTCKRYP